MIVCLCAARRKDKNLRQGFYVLFVTASVVDCLQLIAAIGLDKLISYSSSYFMFYLKLLMYFMSFQAVMHAIVAVNRFSAFYLPTHHEKLWRGPILVTMILCSAAIASFPIVASLVEGFISYRRYGNLMFLTHGSEYDSSGTALIYIVFSLLGFVLSILTLLRLRRHMASEYFDGSLKGQDVRLLVHSIIMVALELLKALYFVSDQIYNRLSMRSCSEPRLTRHDCDSLRSLQNAIEQVSLLMMDLEFFVNVLYCSCGSALLVVVSSYVRQTYLHFYGLSRWTETNKVTAFQTVSPVGSR